ncbi:uncharacterized protein [Amphiura filiformis]|uniref:uncharacterized protein n=1 Tax=Amphiura filiformis TaxID=82378 RepID=UPI003B20FFED
MWLSVVLLIKLLCVLPECMIQIQARQTCAVGQGKDQNHVWRWVLTPEDPCKCTNVRIASGLNKDTPSLPFEPVDVDIPLIGGHDCTCNAGFRRDGLTCTDDNECLSNLCDPNATCTNNPGSFDCTCNAGFSGDGFSCSDDDECLSSSCNPNAACINTPGSFDCTCNAGFYGDGFICTDVDECLTIPCDSNANCNNNHGSYDCTCNVGFSGDGFSCSDDDECMNSPCHSNATCSNNPGSYDCTCNAGFSGDGLNCSDIECYSDAIGGDYRGTVAVTVTGKTCQKWTEQVPHQHEVTPDNYPGIGLGDHNYCRNPDNEPKGTWCYTIDEELRWEYCDIGSTRFCGSGDNECYSDANGADFRGRVAITRTGNVCQKWTEQVPHVHTYYTLENFPESGLGDHNYCRNPDPDDGQGGAWCYTTNEAIRFEYCDIHSSVFCLNTPIDLTGATAMQSSSNNGDAIKAIDGNTDADWGPAFSCTQTTNEPYPWWELTLLTNACISSVIIFNRIDCCSDRLVDAKIYISATLPNHNTRDVGSFCNGVSASDATYPGGKSYPCSSPITGRYITIQHESGGQNRILTLCEVKLTGGTDC